MSDIFADYSFGGWLKRFRAKRDMSMRQTAIKLGYDCGNFSKLERGILPPPKTYAAIKDICDVLEFNETELEMLVSTAYSFHLGKFNERFKP